MGIFQCEICGRYEEIAAIEGISICNDCFYEGQPEDDNNEQ
jgi:ribosome-binding protein aMBF1 (putative translation factor)